MTSQTCVFRIDEKNIDVIFEVCCMALHLIEVGIEKNTRLRNTYFDVHRKNKKISYHLAHQLWSAYGDYEYDIEKLKSIKNTAESIVSMQFNRCSFGFEVSGMDVPLEHMQAILSYAREYRNT